MKWTTTVKKMKELAPQAICYESNSVRIILRNHSLVALRADHKATETDGFFVESHATNHQTYCKTWRRAMEVLSAKGE